ncbi:hypothetical protein DFH07DRAFT_959303 [Mycena maculata]|uniref:DUF6534 domain-containing protein n=1 Tax=Mycena maculata TaxID=230809 RepID=A0AAD7J2K3_9AGAR|nr:hypothetical protein DFH07DRAFT_959303 [Mycena maculata]
MASAAAAQLAALTNAYKELFATTFIGFTVSTTLYGVSVLQTYLYFRQYTEDQWTVKTMVATLWTFDSLTTIFVAHVLYVFVFGFLNREPEINIPWTFTAEKLLVTLITFIAQFFYAHTIWKVSLSKITTAFIVVLAVGSFGLGIYTTVHLFKNPALDSISTRSFLIVSGLVQGLAALNDIVITGALSYYLYIRRIHSLASSGKLIDKLVLYAVSRGTLTAIAQIMFLVLNVGVPHHQYWLPFHMAVGKLYVNSVLATLNVRQSLTQTEVQLGPGVSQLVNQNGEKSHIGISSKPITFAPIGVTNSTMTTVTLSRSGAPDVEQG